MEGAGRPEVTVVVPTRDRRTRLGATLAGVLRQRDVALEVVVVDEGSSDGTAAWLEGLGDDRVRVVRRSHPHGVANARNAGVAEARGDWVAFLDDDDLWAPDKLRRQLDALAAVESGAGFAYCSALHVEEDGSPFLIHDAPPAAGLREELRLYNPVPAGASNVLASTDLVRRLGGFDEEFDHLADWDLWIRLARESDAAVVPEALVAYVLHDGVMRGTHTDRFEAELELLDRRHHGGPLGREPGREWFNRWMAEGMLRAGRRGESARIYLGIARRLRSKGDLRSAAEAAAGRGRTGAARAPEWLTSYPEFPVDERTPVPARDPLVRRLRRRFGVPALELSQRLSGRPRGVSVVFHAVGDPQGTPGRELSPRLGERLFTEQVRYLSRRYRLVRASELPAAIAARRRGGRLPAAITFDDDLSSHAETVAPILQRLGAVATFFLSGASLEAPHSFWFERVDRALASGLAIDDPRLPASDEAAVAVAEWGGGAADVVGEAIRRLDPEQRAALSERMLELAGPDPETAGMRAAAVRDLLAAGHEVGFHTLRHHSLSDLDRDALDAALGEGRERLEAVVGRPLTTIAYPHGRADQRVADAAAAAGFAVGFTTAGAAIDEGSPHLLLPRVGGSYQSTEDLAARLALAARAVCK